MRQFYIAGMALFTLFFAVGCPPGPSSPGPVTIRGRVVTAEGQFAIVYTAGTPPVAGERSAPGAKVYFTADKEGKIPLSSVVTADENGNFTITVDKSMPEHWLIAEHPDGETLRWPRFEVVDPSNQNVVVVLPRLQK